MQLPRRTFLAASSGSLLGLLGLDFGRPAAFAQEAVVRAATLRTTICPYCAVGCGALVAVSEGRAVHVEGDPDHPINGGSLCAKGSAMLQAVYNPRRLAKVKYRAPGATAWEEKDWDWAVAQIARRIQQARDATFQAADAEGRLVHRTPAIASLGGAALSNEECYLIAKLSRALGIVYLEHQARICHSSTVAALGATFGRGAMTNHWIDLANADAILVIGSNVAENHPIAMKWIARAQQRGAKLISVDPRFTRTSAVADLYVPLRAGTDIALIGGLIREALAGGRVNRDYLAACTNAGFLLDPAFVSEAGCFGPIEGGAYTRENWQFQRDEHGAVKQDPSLADPHCVFQALRRHFARYTWETVSRICGTPVETLRQLADAFLSTSTPDRTGTIVYAMGATQHTHGTQNVRSYAILQLLLGNIGVAGGGVNALRGESNVQGSTDHGLLFDLLPGYLPAPRAGQASLEQYMHSHPDRARHLVSLLRAWWGEHAAAENQFAYDYLPKHDGDCSHLALFDAIGRGEIQGLLVWGQNPAVSNPDAGKQREGLEKLRWMAVVDLWETETATFWKRPGAVPEQIATEVFLLPAASWLEKEGSLTNSGRWAQWRKAAIDPVGPARSDLWILDRLCKELKRLYAVGGVFPEPLVHLAWDYGDVPDPNLVAREINGRFLADVPEAPGRAFRRGDPLPSAGELAADGSTAAGNWLYAGSFLGTLNQMARRGPRAAEDAPGLCCRWAWSWPGNRRILYNRAGCDPTGRPWDPRKAVVRYDASRGWIGDRPDGLSPPPQNADGSPNPQGKGPFDRFEEGRAQLFAPALADGPLPEHYEPMESPVANLLSPQQNNPLVVPPPADHLGDADRFPIVATTCRVTEHWQSGAMSRNLPWLVELVPNAFVEISRQLAREKGIASGDLVTLRSARGEVTLHALVTNRLKPLEVGGKQVEQVAVVWHFGYEGLATGPSGNVLTPSVGDGASRIPEYKAFLCDVNRETKAEGGRGKAEG